jgi:hypothetical protein
MHHLTHLDESMQECIENCSDCHDVCMATAMHAAQSDLPLEHVRLLLDCAQICDTSRDYMLRESDLHPRTCGLCATVCETCAAMCETQGGEMMARCAEVCRRCAASCREMSQAGGGHAHAAA